MNAALSDAIKEVHAVAESLGIKAVLVGALVMEFTTEFRQGYPPYKNTNDADFALYVHDWASFDSIHGVLLSKGYARHSKIEHRLWKGTVIIDLIPYGEVSPEGKLKWPISGHEMNVIGFAEVCAAVAPEVRPGLPRIPVIGVPGFVILKMFAFQDRLARQDQKYRNDAEHIRYWLDNYAMISDADYRRFDVAAEQGWKDIDVNDAGAAILGLEASKVASPAAITATERFLTESMDHYSPFIEALLNTRHGIATTEELSAEATELQGRLAAFRRGFAARLLRPSSGRAQSQQ
ncbi:MAG: hypothetical protein HYZ75_06910 [Elusimicrobia bacterium]|nr:hypothetical protein [Elusimicrobiota bacterium]